MSRVARKSGTISRKSYRDSIVGMNSRMEPNDGTNRAYQKYTSLPTSSQRFSTSCWNFQHTLQLMRSSYSVKSFSHQIDGLQNIIIPSLCFGDLHRTNFTIMVTMMYKSAMLTGSKGSHLNCYTYCQYTMCLSHFTQCPFAGGIHRRFLPSAYSNTPSLISWICGSFSVTS